MYFIGDIVFVTDYYYKRKRSGRNHMMIVIKRPDELSKNYYGLTISSKYEKRHLSYMEVLNKNKQNHLHKNSIVYCCEVTRFNPANIKYKVGSINANEYYRLMDKLERCTKHYI